MGRKARFVGTPEPPGISRTLTLSFFKQCLHGLLLETLIFFPRPFCYVGVMAPSVPTSNGESSAPEMECTGHSLSPNSSKIQDLEERALETSIPDASFSVQSSEHRNRMKKSMSGWRRERNGGHEESGNRNIQIQKRKNFPVAFNFFPVKN